MKRGLRRFFGILLAFVMALQMAAVLPLQVSAEEATARSATAVRATIDKQIRAYAKSIDQIDADDSALLSLAKHGVTGGGKRLSVGKSHALTATLMNSNRALEALVDGCAAAFDFMTSQKMQTMYGSCVFAWGSDNPAHLTSFFDYDIGLDPVDSATRIGHSGLKPFKGTLNEYDKTLEWMVSSGGIRLTYKQLSINDQTISYEVTVAFWDRFDFHGDNGSISKDVASLLGSVFFKEFDWDATVKFTLEIPNTCDHTPGNYHFAYDPTGKRLSAVTGDGFEPNGTNRVTFTDTKDQTWYYHELEDKITLLHDRPWALTYTVQNTIELCFASTEMKNEGVPYLVDYHRGYFVVCIKIDGVDNYFGLGIKRYFTYSAKDKFTFTLRNVVNPDGSNMIYTTVYNETKGKTVLEETPMNDHYLIQDGKWVLIDDESTGVSGVDLIIRSLSNKSFRFDADYFEMKVWENGIDGEGAGYVVDKVTKPTCESKGYTTHTCVLCGYSYKDGNKAALGHKYGDWTFRSDATCTAQGEEFRKCANCKKEEVRYSPALGHDLVAYPGQAATCTEDGWADYEKCNRCDYSTYQAIVTEGHRYTTDVLAPTCTTGGHTTYDCEVCGFRFVGDYVEELGHSEVIQEAVAPTCTEDGLTEGRHCETCGEVFAEQTVIGALGHELTDWVVEEKATCTGYGLRRMSCNRCDYYEAEEIPPTGHGYKSFETKPTCLEQGYTTYICHCGESYEGGYVSALGHDLGRWTLVSQPTPDREGQEKRNCTRCDHFETRSVAYQGNGLVLTGEDLTSQKEVWIEGMPYPVITAGDIKYVELPTEKDCILVTYTYQNANNPDIHTQYPTGMKVYKVANGKITHIKELDNLLQYSGSSIRITGKKGIRMITSITKTNKTALTGKGWAGYKLVEYGTALCWASEIKEGDALVLGKSFTRSNYAYKKGVADPIYATTKDLVQYTNVLVGFTNDQCKDDIAMRPYIILEDANGEKITLYGGTIYRSIGYIAYQNRNVVKKGTEAYKYVWDIIHHVYGTKYDADYKG